MSVTINAKGTSVPYFKLGKTGSTLFQGTSDPTGSFTVINGDVWFDTTSNSLKFRSSGSWVSTPGTVTTVSVTTANGVSGSVATATTTPAITLTLGNITPTSVVSSGQSGFGGTTAGGVVLQVGSSNPVTGTTQVGIRSAITATSGATTGFIGYQANIASAASSYTAGYGTCFFAAQPTVGASSTITNVTSFAGAQPTVGTNNAFLSDTLTPTGNWFINQTGSTNNLLSGNIGLATTPPAWEIGAAIAMQGESSFSRYGYSRGIYYDGANYRSISGAAGSQIQMSGGGILFRQSPVTTANAVVTMGTSVILDTTGYVGINKTPAERLDVNGGIRASAIDANNTPTSFQSAGGMVMAYNGTGIGVLRAYTDSSGNSGTLTFRNSAGEMARFDASGNFGVGNSPTYKLDVSGIIRSTISTGGTLLLGDSLNTVAIRSIPVSGDSGIGFYTQALSGNSERMRIDASGNVGIGLTPTASNGIVQIGSYASIKALLETATVTAAAPSSTTNFDLITQAVQYYTTNASTNFTLNIRGNSGTSLNTIMQTGQSATLSLLVTNGGTAFRPTAFQVDGNSVTPKWQGGTAPSAGNINSIDIYTFTVIKTASATYTVLATQTQFA